MPALPALVSSKDYEKEIKTGLRIIARIIVREYRERTEARKEEDKGIGPFNKQGAH